MPSNSRPFPTPPPLDISRRFRYGDIHEHESTLEDVRQATDVGPDIADPAIATQLYDLASRMANLATTFMTAKDLRERAPAFAHYNQSRQIVPITHATDLQEQQLGFACRALVVQHYNTGYIYIPEAQVWIAPGGITTINLPERIEKISFLWYSNPYTAGGVVALPGAYAIAWLYDEWVPNNVSSGATTSSSSGGASTGTPTSVVAAVADTAILAANANRKTFTVFNDSTANLYLLVGAGAASTTVYTVKMAAGSYYECPYPGYTGQVRGYWDAANGNARVTEFS